MKKWMKYILAVFVFFAAAPLTVQAAEKAEGKLAATGNKVAVKLILPEGKTEAITTLRVRLQIIVHTGSMDTPSFTFHSAIRSTVKDVEIKKDKEGICTADIILSGKKNQPIFQDSDQVMIGTLALKPASKSYRITVKFAGETAGSDQPVIRYVDSSGLSEIRVPLANTEPLVVAADSVLKKASLSVTAKNGSKVLAFKWKKVAKASGYRLYEYDSKTKKYKRIKTISGGEKTSCRIKFRYGSKHTFKLRAYKTASDGSKTYGSYSKAVKAVAAPAKVKKFKAEPGSMYRVALSWKKVTGASGYQIYRSKSKKGKYSLVKTIKKGKTIRYTNIRDKKGKAYYKVRAYVSDAGKKRIYGQFSAVKRCRSKRR